MDSSVTQFRSHCLELILKVESGGEGVLITRRGKPVARLTPPSNLSAPGQSPWEALRGSGLLQAEPEDGVLEAKSFEALRFRSCWTPISGSGDCWAPNAFRPTVASCSQRAAAKRPSRSRAVRSNRRQGGSAVTPSLLGGSSWHRPRHRGPPGPGRRRRPEKPAFAGPAATIPMPTPP